MRSWDKDIDNCPKSLCHILNIAQYLLVLFIDSQFFDRYNMLQYDDFARRADNPFLDKRKLFRTKGGNFLYYCFEVFIRPHLRKQSFVVFDILLWAA